MSAADLSAIAAHVAAHPTDDVRWLVLADWLDERSDSRGADVRRWWEVRADLVRAWGAETPDADRPLDVAAAACVGAGDDWWRLAACLNWRLCRDRWPVPYDRITMWPAGWSSDRHQSVLADTVAKVELAAFGLADLSVARTAGVAAGVAGVAAARASRSARAAVWEAESAEWSARAVEWLAKSAAESAELSAELSARAAAAAAAAAEWSAWAARAAVRTAADAAESAAAGLYCRAAELLREGQAHVGG